MLNRLLKSPDRTFLLLGPRGTGKSTWLKQRIKAALTIDLLASDRFIELSARPTRLQELTEDLPPGSWVVVDEVQKVPLLLAEVHKIYEERSLNFALSGSSARKLHRQGADLLAGRALHLRMFPLVHEEYRSQWSIDQAIEWGTLPVAVTEPEYTAQILAAYVETYVREEISSEALVRSLDPFMRFLQTAAIYNAQLLNVENVAREAGVKRTTVERYFQILDDTLLASRLPAYKAKIKAKEVSHPKFYFFDTGVARASAGMHARPIDDVSAGFAFEALLYHELCAYNARAFRQARLHHFGVTGSYDIDFVVEVAPKTPSSPAELILIEAKNARRWQRDWAKPLADFAELCRAKVLRKIVVYRGKEAHAEMGVEAMPAEEFLEALANGAIF